MRLFTGNAPVLWCLAWARVAIALVTLRALSLTWLSVSPASASIANGYVEGAAGRLSMTRSFTLLRNPHAHS